MLSNVKIATRLYAGFGLLVVIIAVLSIFATMQFLTISRYTDLSQQRSATVIGLKDAYLNVRQGRVMIWSYAATGDESYLKGRDDAFARYTSQIADVQRLLASDAEGQRLVGAFKDAVTGFMATTRTFSSLKAGGAAMASPQYQAAIAALNEGAKNYAATNDAATDYVSQRNREAAQQLNEQIERANLIALTLGAAGVVAGLGVAWLIGRSIVNPVNGLRAVMDRLARNDLTVEIPGTSYRDEIGAMARTVEVFKTNAREVEHLRADQEAQKARTAKEQKEAMKQMADTFEARVMGLVNGVSTSSGELQSTAQTLSASATQSTSQATAVAAAAEQTSANVQTVATATEELSTSIAEIARQIAESAQVAGKASKEAEHTNDLVRNLSIAADRIGEVVKLINDIASQTNLLALNATIEAARAGEAGKGFAVVANEVKNLASQTARATEEISQQISSVQEETRSTVTAIESIDGIIKQIRGISTTISSAIEEQGAATSEIARNVQQAAIGTQQVSGNIGGVSESAASTDSAARQVLSAARQLSQNADHLRQEVQDFLTSVRAG